MSLWENRLADLDFIIHHLNEIQRRWVYLEPVFNQGTLKGEEGRFKRVDEEFRFVSLVFRNLSWQSYDCIGRLDGFVSGFDQVV